MSKHFLKIAFFAAIALLVTSCAEPAPKSTIQPKWENKHLNDPNLAGIEIMQLPEGAAMESKAAFVTGHPAMILYFFWDGKVRQTSFEADGRRTEDFFWPFKAENGTNWNSVDFSLGSDPFFLKHSDPRKKKNGSSKPQANQSN